MSTETQNILKAMMVYFKNSREKQDHVIDYLKAVVDNNRREFKRCEELLQKQAHLQLLDREKYNELCADVVKQALGNQAKLLAKHQNVLL